MAIARGEIDPGDLPEEEDDDYEGSAGGKFVNFIISLLVVILIVLLIMVAVRLLLPDSLLSIKMDQITEWIMHKLGGSVWPLLLR